MKTTDNHWAVPAPGAPELFAAPRAEDEHLSSISDEQSSLASADSGEEEPPARDSAEAGRRGAVILEVLAGVRGATAAAEALGISVNHYYQLERKAVQGLVRACEPQPKGRTARTPSLEQQLVSVRRELEEARREVLRQSALVRATQRAMGLPETGIGPQEASSASAREAVKKRSAAAAKGSSGASSRGGRTRRTRRPTVRALRAVNRLRGTSPGKRAEAGSADLDRLQPSSSGPVQHATDPNA